MAPPSAANRRSPSSAAWRGIHHRSIAPLEGAALAAALAVGWHPVFQGDQPKNFGKARWAARAFLRLCARTITGHAERELAELRAASGR